MKCFPLLQKKKKVADKFILRRSWTNFIEKNWLLDLINQAWENVIDPKKSVHQIAQAFDDIYESTLNRHAPLIKTKIRPYYQKGLSKKTLELIKERDKLGAKRNKVKNPHVKQAVNKALRKKRNAVNSRVRKEKKREVINRIKESGNPSELWKSTKSVTSLNKLQDLILKEKFWV